MPSSPPPLWDWIQEQALSFMATPANDMGFATHEPFFAQPLLGVAAGDDSLWDLYKAEAVGSFHWTPTEAFHLAFPHEHVSPQELSVVVWILPQTMASKKDNRQEITYPSERWARVRVFGEPSVNNGLRHHLVTALQNRGIQAVAPLLLPEWSQEPSPHYEFASTWSERHAAYAAGLGTFGLSDGLITPLGKAVRVGSLILRHPLQPTPRPYSHHKEYCLYYQDGSCGECVKRCPAGSVTPHGRHKEKCRLYLQDTCSPYIEKNWAVKGYACGLCQTKVPCESRIPKRAVTK